MNKSKFNKMCEPDKTLYSVLSAIGERCVRQLTYKGFYEKGLPTNIDLLNKIEEEAAELEAAFQYESYDDSKSEKIPEYSCMEEEAADVVLCIMSWFEKNDFDLPGAIVAKINFNGTRGYKHGKG